MTKRVTGRHMTFVFIAFFGVIIAVNVTMAVFASRTFGGTVVDNSYVASQSFNAWLDEAERQERYGWTTDVARSDGYVEVSVGSRSGPLGAATVTAIATHPLGGAEPVELSFAEIGEGRYRSREPLAAGRWITRVEIVQGDRRRRVLVDLL